MLLVVAFHAGLPVPGGFVGVDVFFVISGFVITALILRQLSESRFSLSQFFARRVKRLAPAMVLMIVVVLVLALLLQSPLGELQVTSQTGAGAMVLLANVVILRTTGGYFDAAAETNPLLHTWSLSVEEQFYLLFPLIVVAVSLWTARRNTSPRLLLIVIAAVASLSFVANILLSYALIGQSWTAQPEAWAFYLPMSRAWEFAAGALVAVWWQGRTRNPHAATGRNAALAMPLAVAGLALLALAAFWIRDSLTFPGLVVLLPVVGTTLLIIAGGLGPNGLSSILATRPMTVVGDMSYSIYLWHWPIIVFALLLWPQPWVAVAAAAVSFVPAYLAYRFVEQPIRRSALKSSPVIFLGYAAAAIAVFVLAWSATRIGSSAVPYAQQSVPETIGVQRNCLIADRPFTAEDIERCRFRVEEPKGWILLSGDSHAESFSNAVVSAGNSLGYDVVALSGADCVLVRENEATGRVPNCPEMADTLLDLATGPEPPALVVNAQRGVPVGIRDTFQQLSGSGVPVLRIEGVPQWRPWDSARGPNPCAGGILNASCEISRAQVQTNAPASKEAEAAAIEGIPGVASLDPWPKFCSGSTCSALIDGEVAYSDTSHLNEWGSEQFIESIVDAVQDAETSGLTG